MIARATSACWRVKSPKSPNTRTLTATGPSSEAGVAPSAARRSAFHSRGAAHAPETRTAVRAAIRVHMNDR